MTPYFTHTPWLSFLEGLALALGCAWLAARFLGPRGWMDHPEGRKTHARPTPCTGGVAFLVAIGVLDAMGVISLPLRSMQWGAIGFMGLLGCWDDRVSLPARPKALTGFFIALVLAVDFASVLALRGADLHFAGFLLPNHSWVTVPLLTLWFWSIPQAFNLMDGLDGLALGFLALALHASGMTWTGGMYAFWGIWAGIFLLNYPKPFHFIGDAGALGLGTLLSIIVIQSTVTGDAGMSLWICAYLVVDVTAVVVGRWRDKRPLGRGDRTHLHHGVVKVLGSLPWLGTPVLLCLAGLTTLRPRSEPWADHLAELGLLGLVGLAVMFRARRQSALRPMPTNVRPADTIGMKPPAVA